MTDAAFQATFSDFKLVKTRKVGQFVFEVPVEQIDGALKVLGGMPRADAEAWVGIARLTGPKAASETSVAPKTPGEKAVIRAALLCKEPEFQRFLNAKDEEHAATLLRVRLNIKSRGLLASDSEALDLFLTLEGNYRNWLRA
jgi:hypothetical protein